MTEPRVLFYAVESTGPRLLHDSPCDSAWMEVYDRLELGTYSRLRSYPGARFLGLQEHLERTEQSQRLMGLPRPLDPGMLRRAIHETTHAYPRESVFCRFDLLAGPGLALGTESHLLICLAPYVPVPEAYKREGVGVVLSDLVRNNPQAKRAAFVRERGGYSGGGQEAYERLLTNAEGIVLEGSSSNVFALVAGTLRATEEGVLQGITQRFCLQLAQELGLRIEKRPVQVTELFEAEECFLTSASRGIVPVVRLEGRTLGQGRPGPWTLRLLAAYDDMAERRATPAWPVSDPRIS